MPGFENFISRTFRAPNPAQVDSDRYANALARNQVDRLPQQNRAQDLAIQGAELQINDAQKQNAAGILGRNFAIAANSPRPREAMRAFLASPDFVAAGKLAGLPVEQFSVTDQDTDDGIRQQAMAWANALGAGMSERIGVQSTQILDDGTIATVMDDGRIVRTGERARAQQQPGEPLETTLGPDGNPILTPRSQAAGQEPYQRPTGGLSPRDATTAKNKLNQIEVARQQLALVQEKFNSLKGTMSAGAFGQGIVPTEGGKQFDAAVDSMRNILSGITRVPGVGSMSDFETRLAQAQFPSRGNYESVTQQQIDSIGSMLDQLNQGYAGILTDSGVEMPERQSAVADFATEQEAAAAAAAGKIKSGQRITVGGQSGVWQ